MSVDPTLVIFFGNALDPTLVIFFEMKKFSIKKKLQVWDKSGALIQHLRFFGNEISKKITCVGSTDTCNFFDIF